MFRRVRKIARRPSVCLSVHKENLGSHWKNFHEVLYLWNSFGNLSRKLVTLHDDLCTFMIIYRWIALNTRNVSSKSCRGNQYTYFMIYIFFAPQKSCHLWENVEKYGRARQATDDNVIRRRKYTICLQDNYGKSTSSWHLSLFAFPQQQLWRERVLLLRLYMHYLPC